MKSVMNHRFSQAPSIDIQRSTFDRSHGYKTTFNAGDLIPIFVDEALPGDTFSVNPTAFVRMNTPIYPIYDNLFLDLHWFAVPKRQLWTNFRKFMGEQVDPGDSIDYTMPEATITSMIREGELEDYLGMPTGVPIKYNALYTRAYHHIWNEWYRDQNLQDSIDISLSDAGGTYANGWGLLKRGKRHDYFTSCLPFLQKGEAIDLPLGTTAPIYTASDTDDPVNVYSTSHAGLLNLYDNDPDGNHPIVLSGTGSAANSLYADLSQATASTINELRQAFQIQKLLERDARSGTRYSEIVNSHFGVKFLDVTYRPEYLGGSSAPINFEQVPSMNDGTRKLGDLAAFGYTVLKQGGFTKSFTEHSIVMGIASVRADLTYQQGLDRMFSRSTRYDYYFPALAHIGEQAVLNKEIYAQGTSADDDVFGYQERWAEYRYKQSRVTGAMRSNAAASLDAWHLSQEFGSLPELNSTFIEENPPMDRVVAVTTEPDFFMDAYFDFKAARPMPLYSVPGLIDHF